MHSGLILHSDRVEQCLSDKMKELVQTFGLKQSDRRTVRNAKSGHENLQVLGVFCLNLSKGIGRRTATTDSDYIQI